MRFAFRYDPAHPNPTYVICYNCGMQPTQPFSEREKEVIACLMQGSSNKQIARTLGITRDSLYRHMKRFGIEKYNPAAD